MTSSEVWDERTAAAYDRDSAAVFAPGVLDPMVDVLARLAWLPPGQHAAPMSVEDDHLVLDTYDLTTQHCTSHHYRHRDDGTVDYGQGNFRYIWPAECDLMAQLAGMELESRHGDWLGAAFTSDSESHVSVWRVA